MSPATSSALALERTMRQWGNFLGYWRVCDNVACRRARACRGNIRACAPRSFARLPNDVQGYLCMLLKCREDGLTFEEAMHCVAQTPAADAFALWHAEDKSVSAS